MKVCKDCRNQVWGDGVTYFPQVCIDCKYVEVNGEKEPSNWKPRPMTNADRIRAMSDEELCKFLGECKFCDICEEGCDNCTYHGDCDKRLMDWLTQPAEVDNG